MIEVSHLTKRYGTHTAVKDLSFTIPSGQIYGLLGPNGAGKSTTMNILTGCLAASSGEVRIDGVDIFEEPMAAKRRMGYLPEQPPVYMDRTPREYLRFVAGAKGLAGVGRELERVMELTGIAEMQNRLIRNLSKGYRQRVGIAQAILGDPDTIILDEPTVGLDPKQIIEIRELIQKLGKNKTVILSSHILSEVQAVCGTILILSKGELVACDTPENLEKRLSDQAAVELEVLASAREVARILQTIKTQSLTALGEERTRVCVEGKKTELDKLCRELFFLFAQAGTPIVRMVPTHASLEDIFLELTEGKEEKL